MARTRSEPARSRHAAAEANLQVALDNMPGALVYTDNKLNIVFCNRRFREMYRAPADLLRPGRPYPAFLRHLALNGYYGEGGVEQLGACPTKDALFESRRIWD
jgi:histidine kinase